MQAIAFLLLCLAGGVIALFHFAFDLVIGILFWSCIIGGVILMLRVVGIV